MKPAEQLANLGEGEVTWFEHKFLSMQQQIFLDMGSMNQAYADGGMPAIQEMADAGLFEKTTNPYATDDMLDSWCVINDPNSTPDELHEAAYKMAYREQHDIIQDDYDDMRNHPGTGELVTKMFSTVGQVSVPGAHTMGQYSPTEFGASVTVDPVGPRQGHHIGRRVDSHSDRQRRRLGGPLGLLHQRHAPGVCRPAGPAGWAKTSSPTSWTATWPTASTSSASTTASMISPRCSSRAPTSTSR